MKRDNQRWKSWLWNTGEDCIIQTLYLLQWSYVKDKIFANVDLWSYQTSLRPKIYAYSSGSLIKFISLNI